MANRFLAMMGVVVAALVGCSRSLTAIPPDMRRWNDPLEPFRVVGNIHYVGGKTVSAFLITTPAGHILLDTGFDAGVPRLRENVQKLGFRFEEIKYLLTTHAHIDHVQGHAAVRRLTGAQVLASERDALTLETGGQGDFLGATYPFPPCPVDRRLKDGDEITLGGTTMVAHLTPGHTKGATTWTLRVEEEGRSFNVLFHPSANINPGVHLVNWQPYPEITQDFERSFATWHGLPCDVPLGAHGDFFGLGHKLAEVRAGKKPNPFIDPEGCQAMIAKFETKFRAQLASER